jgi:MFS family permease
MWVSLIVGMLLMVSFVRWELRTPQPLLQLRIFSDRGFAADTAVLGLMSVVFVPFFFASVYSQVSLGKTSSQAGLYLLYFFLGYVIASQVGGRILDRRGARPAIVFGCAISAAGFFLLAGKLTDLSLSKQWLYVAIAGAGIGLMLTPASTDAVNRAPSTAYSEATGITQTARNFGASLGLAVLGTVLIHRVNTNVTGALTKAGVPSGVAHRVASSFGLGGVRVRIGRRTATRPRARRTARVRALDPERLLHHGGRHGGNVYRRGPARPARARGDGRGR